VDPQGERDRDQAHPSRPPSGGRRGGYRGLDRGRSARDARAHESAEAAGGPHPVHAGARNALRRALEESTTLGDQLVRPGDMLLGLLRGDGDDGAVKMLQEQGVDLDWLRKRVTELLKGDSSSQTPI
jgi:hypothetical protein